MNRFLPIKLYLFFALLLIDIYFLHVLRVITKEKSVATRALILFAHCLLALATYTAIFIITHFDGTLRSYILTFIIAVVLSKLLTTVFLLIDELRRLFLWTKKKTISNDTKEELLISRSTFLSWLAMGLGGSLLGSIIYGISNKYNYQIKIEKLHFPTLPNAFKGLKIVQISDIHSGSFDNKKAVMRGVKMLLEQKPDLILVTGDLVNERAIEMNDYQSVFAQLKAPMGVYSILGNHDYGSYYYGNEDSPEKAKNFAALLQIQKDMGWKLLNNEHVILRKGDDTIALIGVENWSKKIDFPRKGDLAKAYKGTEHIPFKILMSHDPSHFEEEVMTQFKDINLTLSGHTHGMQFGVEMPGLKWSPVQYLYKYWAGKYVEKNQVLYVNRGFGFNGYMGRLGILPEITVFELNNV